MRLLSKIVLSFMMMLFVTGCIFTMNNNFGDNNGITKTVDDMNVEQRYEADLRNNRRR